MFVMFWNAATKELKGQDYVTAFSPGAELAGPKKAKFLNPNKAAGTLIGMLYA
jgi:hypothetical protein